VAGFATSPKTPRAGRPLSAAIRVATDEGTTIRSGRILCRATIGRRKLRLSRRGFARRLALAGPVAVCSWRIPANAAGKTVRGSIVVRTGGSTVRRAFARRVAR
jgi:hypothetical protein